MKKGMEKNVSSKGQAASRHQCLGFYCLFCVLLLPKECDGVRPGHLGSSAGNNYFTGTLQQLTLFVWDNLIRFLSVQSTLNFS